MDLGFLRGGPVGDIQGAADDSGCAGNSPASDLPDGHCGYGNPGSAEIEYTGRETQYESKV